MSVPPDAINIVLDCLQYGGYAKSFMFEPDQKLGIQDPVGCFREDRTTIGYSSREAMNLLADAGIVKSEETSYLIQNAGTKEPLGETSQIIFRLTELGTRLVASRYRAHKDSRVTTESLREAISQL